MKKGGRKLLEGDNATGKVIRGRKLDIQKEVGDRKTIKGK